jgi:hypothetical protein
MTNMSQIEQQIAGAIQDLHNAFQNFERDGSGWTIDSIIKLELSNAEYVPLQGSSYIPLPKKIQDKIVVLNIKNDLKKCFTWSILAALHPVTNAESHNPDRVSHYKQFEHDLIVDGIDFPVPISKFEKQNNISINVFCLAHTEISPFK